MTGKAGGRLGGTLTALTWNAHTPTLRRSRRRPLLVAASVLVAVAMLALYTLQVATPSSRSAGGGFANDYRAELESFRSTTATWQAKGQALQDRDLKALLPVYAGIRGATDEAAQALGELHPPAAVATDYTTLIRLLRTQSTALADVITYAKADEPKQLSFALQRYASLVSDFLATRQKVDHALTAS